MNYFFVVAVAVVLGLVHAQENPHGHSEPLRAAEEECATEKSISFDVLEQAENGKFEEITDKLNCFPQCVFEKVGFVTPGETVLQVEVMKGFANQKGGAEHVAIVERCLEEHQEGDDMCEKTFNMYKCYYEKINASKA